MMKNNLVYLLVMVALLTSCSSAYRSSQTPDDVYYSPGQKMYAQNDDQYESYNNSSDDNYLRMKTRDHYRWGSIDDYDYWYDSRYYSNNFYSPYASGLYLGLGFGYGYGYNPYYSYNPYGYSPWHSWYNPYYTVVYYKNPTVYYRPITTKNNLSTYNNRTYNNTNMPLQNGNRNFNNSNLNVNNNRMRNNNNNTFNQNRNNDVRPSRTFNNNNTNSGGGGGSRVGGGGGSRTRP